MTTGRWYEATYLPYDAPVFCRKVDSIAVEVLSRKGPWVVAAERARQLLALGALADAALVARRQAWYAIPEHKRPNVLPLAAIGGALPDGWHRAAQVTDRPGHLPYPQLYLRADEDGFRLYDGVRRVEIIARATLDAHFAVFVDIDGEAVACTPIEQANLEKIHVHYMGAM